MNKFLELAKLILSLIPVIIDTIKAIEAAIPGEGKGEQKLAMVRGALESVYEVSPAISSSFDELWGAISKVVSLTVGIFNATGAFDEK